MQKIIIIKNDWMFKNLPKEILDQCPILTEMGWGNGYALVPRNHPWHGVSFDRIPADVHGGLTFNTLVTPRVMKFYGLSKRHLGKWIIGFDTMHFMDKPETVTREYVINEAKDLAKQIVEYGKSQNTPGYI